MKLQKLNRTLVGALLMSGALGVASQAHAATDLYITPATTPKIDLFANPPANPPLALNDADLESLVLANFGKTVDLGLVYKQNYGAMTDLGNGAPYYSTTFSGAASGATISWEGPLFIDCPSCYLVVKDGNHQPYAYIFDISSWDGQGTLNLSGFWRGPGAISYVAIYNDAYNGGGSLVPEADTYAMLLAGLGLVGFAARRKISKLA
jgi:PEP-CTERM motif